jgi:hypothetical protein
MILKPASSLREFKSLPFVFHNIIWEWHGTRSVGRATMKKLLLCLIAVSAIATSATYGAVELFNVSWSGLPNGNNASAIATIGIDTSAMPNPGSYINPSSLPAWLDSITLTITGAISGNGTFTLSDFQGLYSNTNGGTMDFNLELVGQSTSGSPWGTTFDGNSGDFNLFNAAGSPGAPRGTSAFQLTTNGGSGNTMNLVSFAPVPEPGTYAFLVAGCGAVLALRLRKLSKSLSSVSE